MKTHFGELKRMAVIAFLLAMTMTQASAQSTVYFFVRSVTSAEVKILKNGTEIFDLRGPVKKTVNPVGPMKLPSVSYYPAYRKCQFKDEGKVLFATDFAFTNITTEEVKKYAAEIQVNLSEGDIHYIQLTWKGINDIQFKEIDEKTATKLLKDKDLKELPEYTE
jgi:hypothetical protein